MSESRKGPPVKVTQITAVSFPTIDANYCTLFALCSDGSIWRLQEWRPGEWDQISLPPGVTRSRPPE